MVVDGEIYTFVKASDDDGVVLECWRRYGEEESALVAEVSWHDDTGNFSIRMPEGELPFVLVEAFVREAARWCPPSMRNDVGTRRLMYMPLSGEAVDVWRPVLVEVVDDRTFRIVGENPSPETESWSFATGEIVRCEERRFMSGSVGLVPVARGAARK